MNIIRAITTKMDYAALFKPKPFTVGKVEDPEQLLQNFASWSTLRSSRSLCWQQESEATTQGTMSTEGLPED